MNRRSNDSSKAKTDKNGKEATKERLSSQTISVAPPGTAMNRTRKFYRDPPYGNLMFDPRICRGSPYAHSRMTAGGESKERARPTQKRAKPSCQAKGDGRTESEESWRRSLTPPPIWNRTHASVQTDHFLETLFDFPATTEVDCQTDLFLDRPSSPYYVTEKVGEDVDTQIYPGDLWDFDREVHPIVEVLVGRTIELSMIEVFEEDEIENMKAQQRAYEELREGERAEQRRLEEQERRLQEEKERRIKQFKDAMKTQQETMDRIAAAVLTQGYLADLLPNALEGLAHAGYLLQDIRADMQEHVIPWLSECAERQLEEKQKVADIMTSVVRGVVEARALTYRLLGEQAPREEARVVDAAPVQSDGEEGDKWDVQEMGPEEREVPEKPETLVKGTILVRAPPYGQKPVKKSAKEPQSQAAVTVIADEPPAQLEPDQDAPK